MATKTAHPWPTDLPTGDSVALAVRGRHRLAHGRDPFPGKGLGESDGVARGLADVGVVQEAVDGRGRECLGHDFSEAN